jgi:hypothetical protein
MERVKMQFEMSVEVKEALRAAAEKKGLTPSMLARMILHEHFGIQGEPTDDKTIEIRVNNYRELQGYVEERNLGDITIFAGFAMKQYMSRNALTEAQKQRVEKRYGISLER